MCTDSRTVCRYKSTNSGSNIKGFTLLELLITLVVVSILAAVAIPNYNEYVTRTRRVDCQGVLQNLAINMERFFSIGNTYVGSADGNGVPAANVFPSACPLDGDLKFYRLRITNLTATGYTLQAIPFDAPGPNQSTAQDGDGALQLTSAGQRFRDRNDNDNFTDSVDAGWDD